MTTLNNSMPVNNPYKLPPNIPVTYGPSIISGIVVFIMVISFIYLFLPEFSK